MTFNRPIFT